MKNKLHWDYLRLLTCPNSGGGNLFCGICGNVLPQSLQYFAKGSLDLLAKQYMHLKKSVSLCSLKACVEESGKTYLWFIVKSSFEICDRFFKKKKKL